MSGHAAAPPINEMNSRRLIAPPRTQDQGIVPCQTSKLKGGVKNVRFGSKADSCSAQAHVCFGSKADMCGANQHVRFTHESDINYEIMYCPLWTQSGKYC